MNKRTIYPFLISFVFLIVVIIINRKSFTSMRDYANAVDHTRVVIGALEQLSNHLKSAQIYTPSNENIPEKGFYQLYKRDAESIQKELIDIKELVKDNPGQSARIDSVRQMISGQMPVLMTKNIAEIIAAGESWRLNQLLKIHLTINNAIHEENQLLQVRKKELESSTDLTGVLTIVFSVLAVLIIFFTFISNMRLRRRRRYLEEFLSSVLNTSQNGIVTFKSIRKKGKIVDFRILFANKAIEPLLGLKPEKVVQKRLRDIRSFPTDPDTLQRFIEVAETGEQQGFELLYKIEQQEKWFYVLLAKLEDGVTASFHDITNIKEYQEELHNNIKQLEHSNTELEQYAYVASHDLQEPLRKIRTYASYLNETEGSKFEERGRSYMDKIISAAERMSNLISDILSFSSLKRDPAFLNLDLTHVLKNILVDLDLLIAQKEARIEFDKLPFIEAIPLQMHQLFYNLLNNALKFTKEGVNPVITISSQIMNPDDVIKHPSLDPELSYCQITLKDNGIGFSPEFSEQIFGLFKRLGPKKNVAGSGIGLALCRKVVSNHHGIITAEGQVNVGATFSIILPLKQPKEKHRQI
jgi:PAS domain S-box-containing protein